MHKRVAGIYRLCCVHIAYTLHRGSLDEPRNVFAELVDIERGYPQEYDLEGASVLEP
ncbi:hypothetical protein ATJ93_4025 [Halopiger aswanensis]|uniref:Uncharacterized protein n=1 Tax=Halopiger aswanensis TaxID=148449 RepID=A0A3R7GG10_9EURY|nr:hypothetical protein ATJ93_4025 [Halopiger aswanensis]